MIEWLRNKFASAISAFFVLTVIIVTVGFGIIGYNFADETGLIIGALVGFFLGLLSGIITYGLFATIIHISEKCDDICTAFQNNTTHTVNTNVPNKESSKKNTNSVLSEQETQKFENKDEWISNRIMKLISEGYTPSDAKIQAEAEYNNTKIEIDKIKEKQKIQEERIKQFHESNSTFVYSEHEQYLEGMKDSKEIVDYLKNLKSTNEYFNNDVIPEIQKVQELERLYGNMKKTALEKLKELTK